ncbi:hypothetical protein RJ641_009352 [Dillenia turbinata]|uniref:Uncharacterized protein n=1 Tax=Dillenia turbinata TaxID=194707 RepID=A0AAN8V7R0_9MAGN
MLGDNAVHVDQSGKEVPSTIQLIKLAGANFMQFSSQRTDNNPICSHPFTASLYSLSEEEAKDAELVQLLLTSAEKVLREKIDRETGRIMPKRVRGTEKHSFHLQEAIGITNSTTVAFHLQDPFFHVGQFTGVQLIMEQVASAKKKIHLLIRSGLH